MHGNTHVSTALGSTIRALRQQRSMTLKKMSEQSGLSAGFLSKIERGLSQPSINNLQKICYTLNVTINDLALPGSDPPDSDDESDSFSLLTTKEQRSLIYNLNNVVKLESIFSSSASYKLDAMTLTGSRTEYVSSRHRYNELGIVAQGKMDIKFGDGKLYVMEEGDMLLIPSGTEHRVRKLSDEICISFWFKLMDSNDESGI